jgi:site-specific recombinase XerD
MEQLLKVIKSQKPDASQKTIDGYFQNLKALFKKVFGDIEIDVNKFFEKDVDFYIDFVKSQGKSKSYIRNNLSALQVLFKNPELTKAITSNSIAEHEESLNPEANEYTKSHHLTQDAIDKKYDELKAVADGLWEKTPWTMDDFQKLQDFVMFALVCGRFIAPRRSRDWYDFKLRTIDLDKDNYLDGRQFVFNAFKTGKSFGQQRIDVPPELYRILRKWIRFNKTPWLFVNVKLEPLSAVTFAQKLNKIMGVPSGKTGGFSSNAYRHSYLTNKHSTNLDLKKDMEQMGSSLGVAHRYIKRV